MKTVIDDVGADVTSETSDRSKTEASSIDLEWEHEAGNIFFLFSHVTVKLYIYVVALKQKKN